MVHKALHDVAFTNFSVRITDFTPVALAFLLFLRISNG